MSPAWIFWVALLNCVIARAQGHTGINNIQSDHLLIYHSDISMALDSTTNFRANFVKNATSVPIVAFSINQYFMGDRFITQNFQAAVFNVSSSGFSMRCTTASSTNVKRFSISYIALRNEPGFVAITKSYANQANISTGTGPRNYTGMEFYLFNSTNYTNIAPIPLINGFSITSTSGYRFDVSVQLTNSITFNVFIQTQADCRLRRADITVLFVDMNILWARNYTFIYSSYRFSNNTFLTIVLSSSNQTAYFIGMNGFQGDSDNSQCAFGWNQTASNTTNVTIRFEPSLLSYSSYTILQIIYLPPQQNVVPVVPVVPVEPSAESTSYIPIIAAIVVVVILIVSIVLVYTKCYRRVSIMQMPSKDNFREYPSLSF